MPGLTGRVSAVCLMGCLLLLQACRYPESIRPPESFNTPDSIDIEGFHQLEARGWQLLRPETEGSHVLVEVYRDGPLAKLGHNHILRSNMIKGWLARKDDSILAELALSPWDFLVDEPSDRVAAGAGFDSEPSENERRGTRNNLLSTAVLDAGTYPHMTASIRSQQAPNTYVVELTIAGHRHQQILQAETVSSSKTLTVSGAFTIVHDQFNRSPFSVAGGAIRVADRVEISYCLNFHAL